MRALILASLLVFIYMHNCKDVWIAKISDHTLDKAYAAY
ncbi:hypothetical protein NSP_37030 [Nodularia spumigena CCY9414]|nr:hypothetical protein NSP_37030 [Nodularia spumigena CCY9414]